MSKKVLIITGSPRPTGNTNTLANAFAAGALAAGHEVKFFQVSEHNIAPCHGDCSCFERGYCYLKDDGIKLHELMSWAEILVLSSPVYWKGFTGQLKTVIDRFHPYCSPKARANCTIKETYLISAAMMPSMDAFTAIKEEFNHINQVLHFKNAGELLFPGLNEPTDIQAHPYYIEKAVKMGMNI